ncbi:MAG: response regulator [Candidatus Omnitrophica bacterium]|nr:response regulator [Candidatus Omnitrophota bacterium]
MGRHTVLVVDDEPAALAVISARIEAAGYHVKQAGSGETALESVKKLKPDLIILDVMMPGLNGYEVAAKLKQRKETCETPIIMVTAKAEDQDKMSGLKSGAVYYVTKPYEPRDLLSKIRIALEKD